MNKLINEENRKVSPCRRTPNNLCSYCVLKKVGHNSLLLKYGLHMFTFFQKVQYGRGEKRIQWKNLTNTTTVRWSTLISTVIRHIHSMYPWSPVMRMALYLCVIPPQSNHKLSLSKTSDRSRLRDSLQISDQYALKLKVILKFKG